MRTQGWRGRAARLYRRTTGTHRWFGQHPNRVGRAEPTGRNQIWVGDLTYLAVAGRWWHLAGVLDQLFASGLGLASECYPQFGSPKPCWRRPCDGAIPPRV